MSGHEYVSGRIQAMFVSGQLGSGCIRVVFLSGSEFVSALGVALPRGVVLAVGR